MEKIMTKQQYQEAYTEATHAEVVRTTRYATYVLTDDNFWLCREQARMLSGEYTPITIEGDDPQRFLHVSTDNPDKVAYTKDADKGRADIQTRTTLAAYCEKFEL